MLLKLVAISALLSVNTLASMNPLTQKVQQRLLVQTESHATKGVPNPTCPEGTCEKPCNYKCLNANTTKYDPDQSIVEKFDVHFTQIQNKCEDKTPQPEAEPAGLTYVCNFPSTAAEVNDNLVAAYAKMKPYLTDVYATVRKIDGLATFNQGVKLYLCNVASASLLTHAYNATGDATLNAIRDNSKVIRDALAALVTRSYDDFLDYAGLYDMSQLEIYDVSLLRFLNARLKNNNGIFVENAYLCGTDDADCINQATNANAKVIQFMNRNSVTVHPPTTEPYLAPNYNWEIVIKGSAYWFATILQGYQDILWLQGVEQKHNFPQLGDSLYWKSKKLASTFYTQYQKPLGTPYLNQAQMSAEYKNEPYAVSETLQSVSANRVLVGIHRNDINTLEGIDLVLSGQSAWTTITTQDIDVSGLAQTSTWLKCPDGQFLTGFSRSSDSDKALNRITKLRCATLDTASPTKQRDCFTTGTHLGFQAGKWFTCSTNYGSYATGIHKVGNDLSSIDMISCCRPIYQMIAATL